MLRVVKLGTHIVALVGSVLLLGCGEKTATSPFAVGAEAGAGGMPPIATTGPVNRDPTLGGPCTDDVQCDDGIACTESRCDQGIGRCRFTANDAACGDGVFCNGIELCDTRLGCRQGEPVACSDGDPCTIGRCVEGTRSCEQVVRDADGDGDPPWNCTGGDCDDTDPTISSLASEVCGNGRDDTCNGQTDEEPCVSPRNDTCNDPLEIQASGAYALDLRAAKSDYALSCGTLELVEGNTDARAFRDAVVAIVVPAGARHDVDITASTESGMLKLGASLTCGNPATETRCVSGFGRGVGSVARTRLHNLTGGAYPLYVFSTSGAEVVLDVKYEPASAPPSNEGCASALPLSAGVPVLARLVDVGTDVGSTCATGVRAGDLVYSVDLKSPQDLHLFAVSADPISLPVLSLRNASCAEVPAELEVESELTCRRGQNRELFARALPEGRYYVVVSASSSADVTLSLGLGPATTSPVSDTCTGDLLAIPTNTSTLTNFRDREDSVKSSCLPGAVDAVYSLVLNEDSDLLVVGQSSEGDQVGLALFDANCSDQSLIRCESSGFSPTRLSLSGVPKGTYRLVVESALGAEVRVTPWVRRAQPKVVVPLGDDCSTAPKVGSVGGLFLGNTASMNPDFEASCDFGTSNQGGARDQILELSLQNRSRVVLDATGSSYPVLLNLRKGPECPGAEVSGACALSAISPSVTFPAFVDTTLDPGSYFVQVDGYIGGAGPWAVNTFVTPE